MMRRAAAALPIVAVAGRFGISRAFPRGGGRVRASPGVPGPDVPGPGVPGLERLAPVGARGVSGTNPGEDGSPADDTRGGVRGVDASSRAFASAAAFAASASHGSETPRIRIDAPSRVGSSGTPNARRNRARCAASPLRAAPKRARNDAAPSDNAGFPARRRTASASASAAFSFRWSDAKTPPIAAASVARGVANDVAGDADGDAGSNATSRSNANSRVSGRRAPSGLLANPSPTTALAFGVSPAGVPKMLSSSRLDGRLDGVSMRSARVRKGSDGDDVEDVSFSGDDDDVEDVSFSGDDDDVSFSFLETGGFRVGARPRAEGSGRAGDTVGHGDAVDDVASDAALVGVRVFWVCFGGGDEKTSRRASARRSSQSSETDALPSVSVGLTASSSARGGFATGEPTGLARRASRRSSCSVSSGWRDGSPRFGGRGDGRFTASSSPSWVSSDSALPTLPAGDASRPVRTAESLPIMPSSLRCFAASASRRLCSNGSGVTDRRATGEGVECCCARCGSSSSLGDGGRGLRLRGLRSRGDGGFERALTFSSGEPLEPLAAPSARGLVPAKSPLLRRACVPAASPVGLAFPEGPAEGVPTLPRSRRTSHPEPGDPPGSVIAPLAATTPNVVTRGVRGAPALTDERALSGQQHFGRASSARNGF